MNSLRQLEVLTVRSFLWLAIALWAGTTARAASQWDQPVAQLAGQIATILGSGQAQLTLSNRSTITNADVAAIRHLLEQDLLAHSITLSSSESANTIRVTFSESNRERLWVAEVAEGSQRQVAMIRIDREATATPLAAAGLVLRRERIWSSLEGLSSDNQHADEPVLAVLETRGGLIVLRQDEIIFLSHSDAGWNEQKRVSIERQHGSSRDARGLLTPITDGSGFTAYMAGIRCIGSYATATGSSDSIGEWSVHCHESDDPWPVASGVMTSDSAGSRSSEVKAFYNAARNYFTGVMTPNQGAEPVPFYSVAAIPRSATDRPALLLNGIDGKVQIAEAGSLKLVRGTRDWGSDIAAMRTGCGMGTQIVASSSGEAISDSLRAYDITAQEAVAISPVLEMGGTVTALWTAPDGASAWAAVHKSNHEYEVDRVTALCP